MRQRDYHQRYRPNPENAQSEMARAASRMEGGQDIPDRKHGSFGSIRSKVKGLGLPNRVISKIMGKANAGHDIRRRIDSNIEIIVFACGADRAASMICEKPGLVFMKHQLLARELDFPVDKALAVASGILRSGYTYHKRAATQENETLSKPAPAAFSAAQEEIKLESIREWKARKKEEETRAMLSGIGQELLEKVIGSLKQLRTYDALSVHRNVDALVSSGAKCEEISGLLDERPGVFMSSKIKIQEECRRLGIIRVGPYLERKLQELFEVRTRQELMQDVSAVCIDENGADRLLSTLYDLKVFADEYSMKPEDFKRFIGENLVRLAKDDQSYALDLLMDEIKKMKNIDGRSERPEEPKEKNGKNGKQDAKEILNVHIENAMRFILSVGFRLQTAKAAVENQYFRLEVIHNNTHYRKPGWAEGMNQRLFERILKVAWSRLVKAGAIRFHKLGTCAGVRMASQVRDAKVAAIIREEMHMDRNVENAEAEA